MSQKAERIEALLARFRGRELDAHYLAYFECFNQELFFEAHEVLEGLWLRQRQGPNGAFYKGLIQLAGAFVHLQKHRPEPARALFELARENLKDYPARHQQLDLARVRNVIEKGLQRLAVEDARTEERGKADIPKLALLS